MTDPCDLDWIGSGTDALDGTLGHVRGKRRKTIDLVATVSIDVDQRRNVGDLFFYQRGRFLDIFHRLRDDGDKGQLFDAEARLDLFRPIAKQLCQPGDIMGRLDRAGADGLPRAIDLFDDQIGTAHAKSAFLQLLDQLDDQPADIFVDRLGSSNRFGKRAGNLDQLGRADRFDRLRRAPKHLIEPTADLRTEAKIQGRACRVGQLAYGLEAEGP
ncbi:hypothetical protein D3C73_1018710 [compost metagenome]